jgi:hypothetical protein
MQNKYCLVKVRNPLQKGVENPEFCKITRVQDPIVLTINRSH